MGNPGLTVLAHFVADVLNAAKHRMDLSSGPAVLGAELAGEALPVSEAPIDDQPGQSLSIDGPTPRRPNRPGSACVRTIG